MTNKKSTKRALLMSTLSLLLCVSMLIGTTFAWFTDEVKSGKNVIAAGNLDVELFHADKGTNGEPALVDGNTILFDDVALWEPGAVAYETLTVKNVGDLALKYNLAINLTNENFVVEADGTVTPFGLSGVLQIGMIPGTLADEITRDEVIGKVTKWEPLKSFDLPGELAGGVDADPVTFVIYWKPSEIDNYWNVNNGKSVTDKYMIGGEYALHIDLGVHLKATQKVSESDSFGDDYDKLAPWTGFVAENVPAEENGVITITTGAELAALAESVNAGNSYAGKTIQLGANIDLNDIAWTPIGNSTNKFNGTFIGTGYTISNLYVTGTKGVGLFGYTWTSAHIEGVTIDGAVVSGNDYVGAILGNGYLSANCIKNCTVKNAEITATPYLMADGKTYDGGAKAGAVAGSAYNGNLTGNKVINCKVTAYRDLGGIAGMLYADGVTNRTVTAAGNSVDGLELAFFDLNGAAYESNKVNENMGDVVGRLGRSSESCPLPVVASDNTVANVTRDAVITWIADGVQYIKDVDAGIVKLYMVTDAAPAKLVIPEGVTSLRPKILQGNTAVKEVIIPASVTDFGGTPDAAGTGASGGMFYKSGVEKITLPDGLTEIPAAAFNQAANLKEVNIPSSVTTIGINAFAGTGLTELTIPATVTSIGYGAFRDMKSLTTVTIEGNVNIPSYTFRSCTNLKTVYIKGNNVTFEKGMIFTCYDTGDGKGITIYVANEEIKTRLLAADSAATTYGGYTIVVADYVEDTSEVAAALKTPNSTVLLPAGTYTDFPSIAEGVTIVGQDGVVFNDTLSGTLNNVTIKNVEIRAGNAQRWAYAKGTLLFEDCTFEATSVFAIHYDGLTDANVTYKNCKIVGWVAIASGAEHITFDGCDIYGNGTYGLIRLYSPGTIKNCTFDVSAVNTTDVYQDGIHAVDCEILVENCTNVNGDVTELFNISGAGCINMDGRAYVANATQLKSAVAAGATDIYLLDGEYNIEGCGGKTLTLTGSKNAVLKVMNEGEDGCDYGFGSTSVGNITFNGVTIDTTANTGNYKGYAYMKGTFNDCNFVGAYSLNNANDFVFNRCTFDFQNGYFWTWGANSVTFDGCTFNGNSKTILAHGSASTVININNCTFAATEMGYTGAGDNTAVVEMDPIGSNTYTVNLTGENTKTEHYAGWTRVKDGSTGHTVTGVN